MSRWGGRIARAAAALLLGGLLGGLVVLGMSRVHAGDGAPPGASRPAGGAVVVASKPDTEGAILGYMIGLLLEQGGIPVSYRIGYGTTLDIRAALVGGRVDIYPEYTGNAGLFHAVPHDSAWKHSETALARARELDAPQGVVWLTPAPASNAWAIAVRREIAGSNRDPSLEDFARWVKTGGKVKLAASNEFLMNPLALPAFEKAYGFSLSQRQIMIVSGGDTAETLRAAAVGKYGVNAAMVYGTDGGIAAMGLKLLRDTLAVQPVYQPAPVVRAEVLAAHPGIPDLLAPAFAGLSQETLQALNAQVQFENREPRAVAEAHLRGRGLLH